MCKRKKVQKDLLKCTENRPRIPEDKKTQPKRNTTFIELYTGRFNSHHNKIHTSVKDASTFMPI